MTHIAIVAPCHIPPSEAWVTALKAEAEANDADVIIVDDSDGNLGTLPSSWLVLGYKQQELFLGDLYPEFARMFHKSSACRVLGHIWAYKNEYQIIIGLDSDCVVKRNFVRDHVQFMDKPYGAGWFNPIGSAAYSRGFPYSQRAWPIKANMGLWENVLDINGKDRAENEPMSIKIAGSTVPAGYFPFSGMNWAMHRDAIFGFLFLPNFDSGEDKFRRIDDVWGGYLFQKLMRHMKWSTMVGYPFVYHDTIVDAKADADEEAAMYKWEDDFITHIDMVADEISHSKTMAMSMMKFIASFSDENEWLDPKPWGDVFPAFKWWGEVIKKFA